MTNVFSVLAVSAAAAVSVFVPVIPAGGGAVSAAAGGGNTAWVLIDFDSFSCGVCLEALVGFARAVPQLIQEKCVRGILVRRSQGSGESAIREAGILAKKWNGFRKANDIRFPVFIDGGRFLANDLAAGPAVLLFDESAGTLRAYPLPLRPGQLEEVLAILRK
jgi:hypothetical protein